MNGFSFWHLFKLNIRILRHALRHLQKSAPVKIKGVHVMNALPLTDKIKALLKPFLNNELYNSIYYHSSNSDTLYKFVPKECLPEDFGGELPSIKILNEESVQNLLDNYEFYEWHDSQKVDESKRPVKRK
ncbi:clavesin-1-like [Zophobas morio]